MEKKVFERSGVFDPGGKTRDEIIDLIKSGETVWSPRNWEPRGEMDDWDAVVLDLWREGQVYGYIEGSEATGYFVYGPPHEMNRGFTKLSTEPVESLPLAQNLLYDVLNRTPG